MGYTEKEGFEPPEVLPSSVFKTGALSPSAISPYVKYYTIFIGNFH